jgi:hypothetical protein
MNFHLLPGMATPLSPKASPLIKAQGDIIQYVKKIVKA